MSSPSRQDARAVRRGHAAAPPRTLVSLAVAAAVAVGSIVAACGAPSNQGSPGPSGATPTGSANTAPSSSSAPGSTVPATGPASAPPSAAPATGSPPTPAPTGSISPGFAYGDVLLVRVDRLAVRKQPKRSAALVHAYELDGPAPIDHGLVRLSAGAFVSVHLGPVTVGETVWYLVWPSESGVMHESSIDWYTQHPSDGSPGPGWMATQVGDESYATLFRQPGAAELESYEPLGLNAAGTGPFASAPQPRHDGWDFTWAASTPVPDTTCTVRVDLVPGDGDFEPVTLLDTSTGGVKVSSVGGSFKTAPWLPAAAGSWTTFTLEVSGTCRWAVRLTPLHHD